MSKIRIYFNYALWLLGIREILPKEIIDKVKIIENNEPLVDIGDGFRARATVKNLLEKAQNNLPAGYKIQVVSAFRTTDEQKVLWTKELERIKNNFPNLSEEEQKRKARKFFSEPTGNGPHQTGGAIDVILTKDGQKNENKKILFDAMTKAGFVNYPAEWWHFSYGDQLWGAYSKKKTCPYGPIKP